jgi:hypothetical protein
VQGCRREGRLTLSKGEGSTPRITFGARGAFAMAETLTFRAMTWEILEEKLGIREQDGNLFETSSPVEATPALVEILRRARHFVLVNERARAHRLVDPVLAEIEMLYEGKIITIPKCTWR